MRGYKRIRVFVDRDLRATRFEMAVLDCRVMQRLRDVRQLGQSLVAFPTAEHSRFSHALGALYWSSKMLSYLKENYFAKAKGNLQGNEDLLRAANTTLKQTTLRGYSGDEQFLEMSWFEQLVRLAALLHDITHLPYGHTLEDQAGLLTRHDEDPERIEAIYKRLLEELEDSPHLNGEGADGYRNALKLMLRQCRALHFVGLMLKEKGGLGIVERKEFGQWRAIAKDIDKKFLPYLVLVYDIVNNTICADLIDYLQRDTLHCGMPWTIDKALLSHLKVLNQSPAPFEQDSYPSGFFRLGVAVVRNGKLRHDVITAVLGLLRARYDITEKVYYHHTKCAADAMLEKAIRSSSLTLGWKEILDEDLGDEGLLHHLERKFAGDEASLGVLKKLRSRRFHKAIYKLRKGVDWSRHTTDKVSGCYTPSGRSALEKEIADKCDIPAASVIVSCLPPNMQLKEARALVEWTDGEILHLCDLPRKKQYLPEVSNLTERYLELWSLTVYLDQAQETYAGVVASVCEKLFDHRNDPLVSEYIKGRYPKAFELKEYFESVVEESEVAAVNDLNVATGGGSPSKEIDIEEVALNQLSTRVKDRTEGLKRRRRAEGPGRKGDSKNAQSSAEEKKQTAGSEGQAGDTSQPKLAYKPEVESENS